MKHTFHIVALLLTSILAQRTYAQGGQWAWLGGDTLTSIDAPVGNYGTMGLPASTNWPPNVFGMAYWTGSDGYGYMFGGERDSLWPYNMQHSDMWRLDPATEEWTWMNGPGTINSHGSFGTQGVASASNHPPAMKRPITWATPGTLWLFGGDGARAGAYAWNLAYDDLWKYDLVTQQWTWMHGSGAGNASPNYGSLGVAASNNTPGSRWAAPSWVDDQGRLWLYGGNNSAAGLLEDVWMYDPTLNMWAWMDGSSSPTLNPVWGALGVTSMSNNPSQRSDAMGWRDANGAFLMFGGYGRSPSYNDGFNDLWRYDQSLGEWTWINGQNSNNAQGDYNGYCEAGQPAGRIFPGAWADAGGGNAYVFGGAAPWWTLNHLQNDLWYYKGSANEWVRYAGDTFNVSVLTWYNHYGQQGIPAIANTPQSRVNAAMWLLDGSLYMYGGYGFGLCMDQLWRFDIDTLCALSTSVPEPYAAENADVSAVPNPATSVVRFQGLSPTVRARIFDATGRWVTDLRNTNTVDVAAWTPGIYVLRADGLTCRFAVGH